MSFINFNLNDDYGTKTTMRVGEEGGDNSKGNINKDLYKDALEEETLFLSSEKEGSYKITQSTKETGDSSRLTNSLSEMGIEVIGDGTKTTMSKGEEGGDASKITNSLSEMGIEVISKAQNEEGESIKKPGFGGSRKTTNAVGEEGGYSHYTSNAVGEEGGDVSKTTSVKSETGVGDTPIQKVPIDDEGMRATTNSISEEGGGSLITSSATGEEGGDGIPVYRGEPKEGIGVKDPGAPQDGSATDKGNIDTIVETITNAVMDALKSIFDNILKYFQK